MKSSMVLCHDMNKLACVLRYYNTDRRTEPWRQEICTKSLMVIRRVVLKICSQTDKHTDKPLITILRHPYRRQSKDILSKLQNFHTGSCADKLSFQILF